MQQILTDAELDNVICNAYRAISKICRLRERGMLSDHEFMRSMRDSFNYVFFDYLHSEKQVVWQFSESAWLRFVEEYHLWKAGGFSKSSLGDPWLFFDPESGSMRVYLRAGDGISDHCQALGLPDERQFFRLMDAFFIPPDYFKCPPREIENPRMHNTHVYGSGDLKYVIGFHCTDDGGLKTDGDPVGENFTLVSDRGLKAKIKILEVRSKEQRRIPEMDIDDFLPLGAWLAKGTIEGYTTERKRKIVVRTDKTDMICALGTILDWEDMDAVCYSFPMWQDYFEFTRKSDDILRQIFENIYNHFRSQGEE